MSEITAEAVDKIKDLGAAAMAKMFEGQDGERLVMIPPGYSLEHLPDPNPKRITEAPTFEDAVSFSSYVNEFKNVSGATQLFASTERAQFIALLDYHKPGEAPQRRSHMASYKPMLDPVFGVWKERHGKPMKQEAFIRFIEEHAPEIVSPDPAQMLEIASDLDIKVDVRFKSKKNIANGMTQLIYTEDEANKEGSVSIPKELTISSPVFFGGEARAMKVFLRYSVGKGEPLSFTLEIHRLAYLMQEEFAALASEVGTATGIQAKFGLPTSFRG